MKKFKSSMLGVTLLEIMLVLAIAAMIIVMSVRYYQSASASSQANSLLQQLQAITAMADQLAQTSGTYSQVSSTTLQPLLPANGLKTPWGGTISVTAGANSWEYTVDSTDTPDAVCSSVIPKLKSNPQYKSVDCTSGTLSYTYTSRPDASS